MIETRCSRQPLTTVSLLLCVLLIPLQAEPGVAADQPQRPPNIVLFLADDLGWAPEGIPPKMELFNLRLDPSESSNLAAERRDVLQQMQTRLHDVAASDNDALVPRT